MGEEGNELKSSPGGWGQEEPQFDPWGHSMEMIAVILGTCYWQYPQMSLSVESETDL